MSNQRTGPGRPTLPPDERKDNRVVLSLNETDVYRLDRLVATDQLGAENRQDMLRFLIREEFRRRGLRTRRKRESK